MATVSVERADVPELPDLEELWKVRANLLEFKVRDVSYQVYENAYRSRDPKGEQLSLTWRPVLIDGTATAAKKNTQLVNMARQIVNHHQATFARPPRLWNVPYSQERQRDAANFTAWLQAMLRQSGIKSLQPRNSYWLSVRGDGVYGMDWLASEKRVFARTFDPRLCYPQFSEFDVGEVIDMLISFEVDKLWAQRTYSVVIPGEKRTARVFIYWDAAERMVQVDKVKVPSWYEKHDLGFCPFRWAFNQGNGLMAEADLVEIPKLQELLSDSLLLALDAARKQVDKAYWGVGIKGDVAPVPGRVKAFPNPQASIHEFPTAAPPQVLTEIMGLLQSYGQAMAGISPISMEGLASGSIVTGSAVRHQVEAIEARAETKRTVLEHTFARLGEMALRILESKFGTDTLLYQDQDQRERQVSGSQVMKWYQCEAAYGGFEALGPTERGRWALEGLGRVHDDRKAIEIAYPDEDPERIMARIRDFQLRQAAVTGQSQAVAQQAIQQPPGAPGAQPGSPPAPGTMSPGGEAPPTAAPPQRPGQPPAPGMPGGPQVKLGDVELAVKVVASQLHGHVWAVGELAAAGSSNQPVVAVQAKQDQGLVGSALTAFKATVVVGKQSDLPAVEIA